jgi:RNA polymerase sigma factor (sigma-70 family)
VPDGPGRAGPPPPARARDWSAEELTRAIARGDGDALSAFYREWFDRVYGMARSLTRRDESFCLDVVQEAMLRVVRSMRAMRSEDEVARWMTRVVHTAALDLLRRESRRAARERRSVEAAGAAAPPTPTGDERAEAQERIAWVRARLAELPAEDSGLVGLRIGRGQSLDRAGASEGMTGDAAHGRVRRAVSRLRAMAKEAFGEH